MLAHAAKTSTELAQHQLDQPHHLADALSAMEMPGDNSAAELASLHEQFVRYGYVRFPAFLSGSALDLFREEMAKLERLALRRGFDMPGYNTPRRLSVLGGSLIRKHSPDLSGLYHHHAIRSFVERIAGRRIYSCRHPEEFMVANFLQTTGDTHGWHLDDPPLALVIFAEAPSPGGGGEAEIIVNWHDLCRRKDRSVDVGISDLVGWSRENDMVEQRSHGVGDAYLLRADLNLHRVAPLTASGEKRWVVNMAFQTDQVGSYGETASLLYSPDASPRPAACSSACLAPCITV
ncbi:HalD/BesD family halogenase [Methylorubrum extorquens]